MKIKNHWQGTSKEREVKEKLSKLFRKGEMLNCQICGKEIYRSPSRINKKYCSIKCQNEGQRKNQKGKKCPWVSRALKGKKRLPFSENWRKKIGESLRGKIGHNSRNWKGGLTPLILLIRHSSRYNEWRVAVFTRDYFICQECGEKGILEAHHIKRFTDIIHQYQIKTLEEALNCKELWNLNNGLTLCLQCHNITKQPLGGFKKVE